jgi:hypothetical protein
MNRMPELFKPCEANASLCATRAYKVFNDPVSIYVA